jgi:Asp/Glu/hydantoin racemase
VTTIGFLHTSAAHVATFTRLLTATAPDLDGVHAVDEALLDDARVHGVDDEIRARLGCRLSELTGRGAGVVVCTCSTLGGEAETLSDQVGRPVMRIDRPMAERAAAIAGRIAVVTALESTLVPTRELLGECLAASGRAAVIVESPCLDAWALFEAGDLGRYAEGVADHARALAPNADVIVLAQASMAPAADRLRDLPVPVLSSPSSAVARAVELVRGQGKGTGAAICEPSRSRTAGSPT